MGSEAALAFQLASGLTQGVGAFMQSRTPVPDFNMDQSTFDKLTKAQEDAIKAEVGLQNRQADIAIADFGRESIRFADASQYREQELAQEFNNSGLRLTGTPAEVMAYERKNRQAELDNYRARIGEEVGLARQKATLTGIQGRAQLTGLKADLIGRKAEASVTSLGQRTAFRQSALSSMSGILAASLSLGAGKFAQFRQNQANKRILNVAKGTPFTASTPTWY